MNSQFQKIIQLLYKVVSPIYSSITKVWIPVHPYILLILGMHATNFVTGKLFSMVSVHFYTCTLQFPLLHILAGIWLDFMLFHFNFILYFLVISEFDHHLICVFLNCVSFSENACLFLLVSLLFVWLLSICYLCVSYQFVGFSLIFWMIILY